MQRLLMQYVDLPHQNFHVPPGLTDDVDVACAAYEAAIRQAGGVDLWVLGIGTDGHIAFNEPGSERDTRTRRVQLEATTIQNNARFFEGDVAKVPKEAVSVGVATIMDAREIVLLAKGKSKAHAIARAAFDKPSSDVPASWLQSHENCVFIVDEAAASELTKRAGNARTFESASGIAHTLERRN